MSKQLGLAPNFSVSLLLRAVFLFLAYLITARVGLSLDPVGGFAAPIWPPTGIALAYVILYGWRMSPAIALAAFLVNYTQGAPWWVALFIAIGNTSEALVGAYLLRRFARFGKTFHHLKDVVAFVIYGVVLSTTISATIGSLVLWWGGAITQPLLLSTWTAWWVGDMLGALIIVPFILFWRTAFKESFSVNLRQMIETVILFTLLIFISSVIFLGIWGIDVRAYPISYLIYIPLIIISFRLSPRGHATAMVLLTLIAVLGTLRGTGLFVRPEISSSLLLLLSFIGVTGLTFLPLAVLVQEKREFELLKDEFMAIASHELKTPLTTIKAYTDLLKRRYTHEKISSTKEFGVVDDQIKILVKLINDMLDITRINTGKMEIKQEEIPISEFVKDIATATEKIHHKRKILVTTNTKAIVIADRYKLQRVLTNLLTNAMKYSKEDQAINIKMTSNKESVTVAVKDQGMGIKKKDLSNVFKRFYQAQSKEGKKKGLGLGLYISNEIIKRHNGKMWAKSAYGKGSTFYFSLPIKKNAR